MRYKRAIANTTGNFFLFGPRGTGKSTWLSETYPDALLIDLLREDIKVRLETNPERLVELVDGAPETHTVIVKDSALPWHREAFP